MKIREPVVAGQFYPGNPEELTSLIEEIQRKEEKSINRELAQKTIIGGIVPHAGYMFSAYQAVHFFDIIQNHKNRFDTIIILNPSHTGMGHDIAVDYHDKWHTPLGYASVDKDFAKAMDLPLSETEQMREHSGEVMVPLLQHYLTYEFQILPVTITNQNYENAKKVAQSIKNANDKLNRKILLVASSDFSHFVHPKTGEEQDQLVVDKILEFKTREVEEVIRKNRISVCGYGPIMAIMEYAKLTTDSPGISILKKGNSGDIIPSREVVDYVSMLFYQ